MRFHPPSRRSVFFRDPLLRSFLGEETLIANRDVVALNYKWSTTIAGRVVDFAKAPFYKPPEEAVVVCADASPIFGRDGNVEVKLNEPIWGLHVDHYAGARKLRDDLALAAEDIGSQAREASVVLGVTFSEVASLAIRGFGFNGMDIIAHDEDYSKAIESRHRAFRAINPDRQDRPFAMAAVYLPTQEFVTKFGA